MTSSEVLSQIEPFVVFRVSIDQMFFVDDGDSYINGKSLVCQGRSTQQNKLLRFEIACCMNTFLYSLLAHWSKNDQTLSC